MYFNLFVPNFKWIDEYSQVVDWLSDNQGKGLCMYGSCGRGKTVLAKYVLPAMLLKECSKVLKYSDIQDLRDNFNDIISKKLICIDDIGTEELIINFGNKLDPFCEIIDIVEKKEKLIVFTSNLTAEKKVERYGVRVLDRIKSTTKRVLFKGESFR
jgi:DNA replication protein DnaC